MKREIQIADNGVSTLPGTMLTVVNKALHQLDIVFFKVTVDYILRNFDPTGIDFLGIINSAWNVLIAPYVSSIRTKITYICNRYMKLVRGTLAPVTKIKTMVHYTCY